MGTNLTDDNVWNAFVSEQGLDIVEETDFSEFIENCGYEKDTIEPEDLTRLFEEWTEISDR